MVVLTTTFFAVNKANIANTHREIQLSLKVSAEVFSSQFSDNIQKLTEIAHLLSSDYAFKTAYSSHDRNTILSAMENHLARISGDNIMMLVSLDHKVIANTFNPELNSKPIPVKELQLQAENNEYGEATRIILLGEQLYQMIVVPLFLPDIEAWIHIGFPINKDLTEKISAITRTNVSILYKRKNQLWTINSSTLGANSSLLVDFLNQQVWQNNTNTIIPLADDEYISLVIPLSKENNIGSIITVINRSLNEALLPYNQLRTLLFILFSISLAVSLLLAFFMARQITLPVKLLTKGAQAIQDGDYNQTIEIKLKDEIGTLAHSFNNMAKGLAEKEKIHNLLGKVVSPAIAEELLKKDVELGGEERMVTTLFSDIRNFTEMCEGRAPAEILSLLNEYFTSVTSVIENNNGVVDKYIGDALMALFGAPLKSSNDANNAVNAAIEMCSALKLLNHSFNQRNISSIRIGIGINSDIVVVGNMGSISRMNYTVIGAGVNFASRLEGLTKTYGVEIIISESSMKQADHFIYQELDLVRVKGKTKPCKIYTPLCNHNKLSDSIKVLLQTHTEALRLYQQQQWRQAQTLFKKLRGSYPQALLYPLYIKRCQNFIVKPPENDWDGCYTFTTK